MADELLAMLNRSLEGRKGITLYLNGQQISVVVTEIMGSEAVKGRNQEYDHVLVRLDQVIGAAMN